MTMREIVTLPQSILRQKAHKVTDFGPNLQTLANDMVETMRQAPGVGLAAPQVGESLRLIVIEYGDDEDEKVPPKLYVMANPEITRFSQ
jgi:peptide deformylase